MGQQRDADINSLLALAMLGEAMQLWFNTDLQPIDAMEADALLRDDLARRVTHTALTTSKGRVEVSTIFLVLNHAFMAGVPPLLWETMVFGGPDDMAQRRYSSREAALVGHAETVTYVKVALDMEGTTVIAEETFEGATRAEQ